MKNLLLILSVFFTSYTYCQDTDDKIAWKASKKLTWDDFQAVTDSSNYGAAKTSYQIRIIPENVMLDEQDQILDYEDLTVQAEFNKDRSWSMAKFDTIVLAHEQLHFDIAELFARKIRKKILDNKIANKITYDTFWTDYKKLWKECTTLQRKFDTETNHGRNFEQNTIWKDFVESELKMLEKYE
jgi:hypothetical protein